MEIRDASSGALVPRGEELGGELRVRGAGVFQEYFRRPEATAAAFDQDGWFITGDHASCDADGVYLPISPYISLYLPIPWRASPSRSPPRRAGGP